MLGSLKRVVVGRPIATYQAGHHKFGIFGGLAVLSADALSSVAYATEEVLRVLMIGGLAAMTYSQPISVLIAILLIAVAFSFRQTIFAFPGGGGAYVVTRDNLGPIAGPGRGRVAADRLHADRGGQHHGRRVGGDVGVSVAARRQDVAEPRVPGAADLRQPARPEGVGAAVRRAGLRVPRGDARPDRHRRGAGHDRRCRRRSRRSIALPTFNTGADHDVPPADRVCERLHGADRRRGRGRRRADVQGAAGEERGAHDGDDGRPRRDDVRRPDVPGARLSGRAERNRDGGVAAGARRVRRPQPVLLRRAGGDDADPDPRGEHGVCGIPDAGVDRRARSLHAAAVRQSRRQAVVLERHRRAEPRRGDADHRVRRRPAPLDSALHDRRVPVVHAVAVEHVPAHDADARAGLAVQRRHQRLRRAADRSWS